jgi:hypothetical protein
MAEATQKLSLAAVGEKRGNADLWWGLVFTVLGVFSNFLYFFLRAGQSIFPWVSLIVPVVGLVFLFIGLKRAFGQPQIYRGKIWGSIVTAVALLFFAGSVWGFFHARALPGSAGAPQIGQHLPDFTLPDSGGQPVSLAQMLSTVGSPGQPKALLLVFYRGYW